MAGTKNAKSRAEYFDAAVHFADRFLLFNQGALLIQRAHDDPDCWTIHIVSGDWLGLSLTTGGAKYSASMGMPSTVFDETKIQFALIFEEALDYIVASKALANLGNAQERIEKTAPDLRDSLSTNCAEVRDDLCAVQMNGDQAKRHVRERKLSSVFCFL